MNYDEAAVEELEEERVRIAREVRGLRDHIESFDDRYPRFSFTYSDPEKNFDRRRVRGVMAKLFDVVDPKFMMAIEIAAGGRVRSNFSGLLVLILAWRKRK